VTEALALLNINLHVSLIPNSVVGSNHSRVYFIFYFSFFTSVIFIRHPTICGEMNGFRVYIGVWEMMPKFEKSD
jgi:hypothetical protein